jgi:hypothetical protein
MPETAPLRGGSESCDASGVQAQFVVITKLARRFAAAVVVKLARRFAAARASRPLHLALRSLALITVCLVSATYARAQDVQRFHPALDDQGFLGLDGTRPPGSLRLSVNLMSDLAWHPVELATPQGTIAPVTLRFLLHLGAEIGLGGRGAIAARIPLIAFQDGPFRTDGSQVFMLADPQLWARYRLLGPSMSDRNEPKDGPGLMLQAGAMLPLGRRDAVVRADEPLPVPVAGRPFASDGRVHGEVSLLGDFQILGAGVGGSVGYRRHFWDPHSIAASATGARDELTFAAALKLPIPVLPNLAGVVEVRGVSGFHARSTAVEIDAGARFRYGTVLLVLGGGGGVTSGVGAPDGRLFFGVYWVPPEADKDQDGVDDDVDQCPFLAEDRDGFQDSDGCPDPDNDNDLVPDLDDRCPNESAEEGRDENEDGCTDAN